MVKADGGGMHKTPARNATSREKNRLRLPVRTPPTHSHPTHGCDLRGVGILPAHLMGVIFPEI